MDEKDDRLLGRILSMGYVQPAKTEPNLLAGSLFKSAPAMKTAAGAEKEKSGRPFSSSFCLVFLDSILFGGKRSWARLLRRHTHHTQVGRIPSPQSKVLRWVVVYS